MDVYAENILDHYRHPRNKGKLETGTCAHHESNPSCGDDLTVEIVVEDDILQAIGWDGVGCAISQAAISMLCEEAEGLKVDDILGPANRSSAERSGGWSKDDIYELLGVPIGPRRFKCALLCLHTLKNALRTAEGLEPQSWLDTVGV